MFRATRRTRRPKPATEGRRYAWWNEKQKKARPPTSFLVAYWTWLVFFLVGGFYPLLIMARHRQSETIILRLTSEGDTSEIERIGRDGRILGHNLGAAQPEDLLWEATLERRFRLSLGFTPTRRESVEVRIERWRGGRNRSTAQPLPTDQPWWPNFRQQIQSMAGEQAAADFAAALSPNPNGFGAVGLSRTSNVFRVDAAAVMLVRWGSFVLVAIIGICWAVKAHRINKRFGRGECLHCGYPLVGEEICSECGLDSPRPAETSR